MSLKNNTLLYGKVVFFNENLGTGIIRLDTSSRRIKFNYKSLDDGIEGFKILFPGDRVQVLYSNNKVKVNKIGESLVRAD